MTSTRVKSYIDVPASVQFNIAGQNATHLKVIVDYEKGGMNYFTYKTNERGYYVYITPIVREDGCERSVLMGSGSGFKVCLGTAARLHRGTLEKLATAVDAILPELTPALLADDRAEVLRQLTAIRERFAPVKPATVSA